MSRFTDETFKNLLNELTLIWAAHRAVGLTGKMCLYTLADQQPWRAKEAGLRIWFGPEEEQMVDALRRLRSAYNDGNLPNSPLLLNPLVHAIDEFGSYEPIGSGVIWATALALGAAQIVPEAKQRLDGLNAWSAYFKRGENAQAGLKILAPVSEKLLPEPDGLTVPGCKALYELTGIESEEYAPFYLMSGLEYLGRNGSFIQQDFEKLLPKPAELLIEDIGSAALDVQAVQDAGTCWNAYDRHHSLYEKFGIDPANIEQNLHFYNLCARDITLFDATGPQRQSQEDAFEFLVEGWVPRGAITVMGATGGTGKSSMAHRLAVLASIDWEDDEQPLWLGSKVNKRFADGLVIYFSGEDTAAIVNARARMIDPEGRSKRLMLQHTDFGTNPDGSKRSIGDFLAELQKLPNVSLVVIDPARKYLEGDEDDSEVVSRFFEAIEEFAHKKRCGMVVVHHLVKGAKPRDTRDIYDMLRGSQVFIDRPRAVIGMMRDGAYTLAGLSKNNIPPNLGTIKGERVFARDAERLDLLWLPGDEGVRRHEVSEEELEAIKQKAQQAPVS